MSLFPLSVMEPVIVYMRDQICGETRLKSTSLKSLGLISGRGLLRLNQRQRTQESVAATAASATAASDASDTPMDVDVSNNTLAASTSTTATAATAATSTASDDPLAGMKLSHEQMKMIESISEGYREYQRDSGQNAAAAPSAANTAAASAAASSSFPVFPAPNRDFLPDMPPRGSPSGIASSSKVENWATHSFAPLTHSLVSLRSRALLRSTVCSLAGSLILVLTGKRCVSMI